MTTEVAIAAGSGTTSGGNSGMSASQVENAMHYAAAECAAQGIADDTPHDRLLELVGEKAVANILGDAAETATGADYIRAMKLLARDELKAAAAAQTLE